ncbi:MAG: sulfurtransferase TusA family protein [Chloroflexi bacterium]|nr:sulfurtransferase TusA family protein [Chloroflexota bacterium]MBU1746957.1 sulfurtransferase TusA family protein [Chloroflexota bacterium]
MNTVDARGLSCPEPVLRTSNALKDLPEGEQLQVLVETVTSRENVSRMARSKGYNVEADETEDGFCLLIGK